MVMGAPLSVPGMKEGDWMKVLAVMKAGKVTSRGDRAETIVRRRGREP